MFEAFQKQGTLKACACFTMQRILVAVGRVWLKIDNFPTATLIKKGQKLSVPFPV
jgi:hypothetical protein